MGYYYTIERAFSNVFFSLWSILLIASVIYRLATADATTKYIIYYTNWSWIFQAVFYNVDMFGRIFEWVNISFGKELRRANILCWLWIINGNIWIVSVVVAIIVNENVSLLTDAATTNGGLGFVINMHVLFHYVPGYFILLYMILERDIIGSTIISYFPSSADYRDTMLNFLIGFVVTFSASVPMIIYIIIFDPQTIYGYTTPTITIFMISLVVLFFLNVIPFVIFVENYIWSAYEFSGSGWRIKKN
jgi:hypothetical protein